MGILFAMFTRKKFRENAEVRGRARLLVCITLSYVCGALISAITNTYLGFQLFYIVCFMLVIVLLYDHSRVQILKKYSRRDGKKRTLVNAEHQSVLKKIV
jgi:hypothetical protein